MWYRIAIWYLILTLQFVDIYTTSLVDVGREANPFMAGIWSASNFWFVACVKLVFVCGLVGVHALLVKYLSDFEVPFVAGLAASMIAMLVIVSLNFVVL